MPKHALLHLRVRAAPSSTALMAQALLQRQLMGGAMPVCNGYSSVA